MRHYYQDEAVTIYHGDCREILGKLPSVDLILTDPPYGIGADEASASAAASRIKAQGRSKAGRGWKEYACTSWDREIPTKEVFDLIRVTARSQIIWGGNYFTEHLPPSQCWLAWDKGQRDFSLADFELAWTSFDNASRMITVPRSKALRDGKEHPTQKSLDVIKWCITAVADRYSKTPAQSILDPFMGSGTTLRAAKDLGRKAVGIEREEAYCEIAARRMSQEVLAL